MAKLFHPYNRTSLVEAVCPPENYSVDCAVGTTYSMDFESLTAIMLGFLALEAEPEKQVVSEGDMRSRRPSVVNVLYSLRAIGRFTPNIRVYVNHGFIHPKRHSQMFQLYDRIVRQVSFVKYNTPASFHPKVWVIKYTSTKEIPAIRYRLLVQSRNLTSDHFFDLAAVLDGVPEDHQNPSGRQVSDFIKHIIGLPQENKEQPPERIINLLEELRRVKFQPPEGSNHIEFLWNSPGVGTLLSHIPRSGQSLVLSPFLDNEFVGHLATFYPLTLISTSEALDNLSEDTFAWLCAAGKNKMYAIDNDICDDENNPGNASDKAYGLHGKMFLFEDKNGVSSTILGSANATMRGFERNNEAVLKLSPGISIAEFKKNFMYNEKKELNAFIREYTESDYKAVNREEKNTKAETDRVVNDARTALCQLKLKQIYSQSERRLVLRSDGKMPPALDSGLVTVRLCPLGLVERFSGAFPDLGNIFSSDGILFTECQSKDLSEFVHLIIDVGSGNVHKEFIVKTEVNFLNLLDERDRDIKRSMLSNSGEDFLRLILFGDIRKIQPGTSEPCSGKDVGISALAEILGESVTFEDIMRACTEEPDKIEEVNLWLQDVYASDILQESTNPFIQFWKAFNEAMKVAGTRSKTCL